MLKLLKLLRQDEYGVILSAELVLVGSLLVVGMITGLTCLQQAVDGELRDVGAAIGALDQSYAFAGQQLTCARSHCCAYTAGSSWTNCEQRDVCRTELVGADCCEQHVAPAAIGNCCQTNACRTGCSQCGTTSACGSCGTCSQCGHCGTGQGLLQGRSLGLDVPNFRGTEWGNSFSVPLAPPCAGPGCSGCAGCDSPLRPVPEVPQGHPDFANDAAALRLHSGDIIIPDHVW